MLPWHLRIRQWQQGLEWPHKAAPDNTRIGQQPRIGKIGQIGPQGGPRAQKKNCPGGALHGPKIAGKYPPGPPGAWGNNSRPFWGPKKNQKNPNFRPAGQPASRAPGDPQGGCFCQPLLIPTTSCLAGAKYVTKNNTFLFFVQFCKCFQAPQGLIFPILGCCAVESTSGALYTCPMGPMGMGPRAPWAAGPWD